MGDVIVMCAECGLHAMVSGNLATITPKAKCKHRQNPANCPVLGPVILRVLVRQTAQRPEQS